MNGLARRTAIAVDTSHNNRATVTQHANAGATPLAIGPGSHGRDATSSSGGAAR